MSSPLQTESNFPPFVPAKPKGGVAAELAQAKVVESTFKPKRKRRTAAEMAAANSGEQPAVDTFAVYAKMVGMLEAVNAKTRLEILHMLMEHHT